MGLDALAEPHNGPDHAGGGVVDTVVCPVQGGGRSRLELLREIISVSSKLFKQLDHLF